MLERIRVLCFFLDLAVAAFRRPDETTTILHNAIQEEQQRKVYELRERVAAHVANERRKYRGQKLIRAVESSEKDP
jgi:hypothetical protein